MALDLLLLAVGLALLTLGGETVVRGATGLARALGVSPLVIGLTVVAFGTSAPELAVNVIAAWADLGEISFGNIIGSNMANVGLIVGCTALIRPIVITGVVIGREIPMMLLATAAAIVMGFDNALSAGGALPPFPDFYTRADGVLLLMFFLVFLYYTVGDFVKQRSNGDVVPVEGFAPGPNDRVPKHLTITAFGLGALVWGADITVDAASHAARLLGVPDVVIGLTIIAIGTSLPELVASIAASMRGHAELAIGNIVGSNIFNLLLVMGITSVVRPIPVPIGGHLDLLVIAVFSLILFGVSATYNRQIIRTEAVFMITGYFGYMIWRSGLVG
jgi:cation:H+ antiporter